MSIDAFEPYRAIGDRGVEVGGGREAAEPPGLLVPAAADDPRQFGIVGGIFADRGERLVERPRARQVERH